MRPARAFLPALLLALLAALPVSAQPVEEDTRPFGQGTFLFSGALGGSWSRTGGSLTIGVGMDYLLLDGVALGVGLLNDFLFYSGSTKEAFPGIEEQTPTYIGQLLPRVHVLPYRSEAFSPYVTGGVGPVLLNNDSPLLGRWTAGVGAWLGMGGGVALDVGFGVSSLFSREACQEAFTYVAPDGSRALLGDCGLEWAPRLGLLVGVGG